jgi:hypothetical protein
MRINTIIIDNFLDNPDLVRKSVLNIDFKNTGSFPGIRSDAADEDYQKMIGKKLFDILGFNIKYRKDRDCFRFQLCLDGSDTWIHKDDTDWAGVLYLTPDAPVESGTGIFDNDSNLVTMIGNVYNRLVLYRGDLFHRSVVPGFGDTPSTGRLTQVFFFDEEK